MTSKDLDRQRLQDLEDNLDEELKILKQYEDKQRYETDPRMEARYQKDIERQRQAIYQYQKEYQELKNSLSGDSLVPTNDVDNQTEVPLRETNSIPHNIPTSNIVKFVGRSDTLERLHQRVQKNDQGKPTAIYGMPGVGKTELARQYSLLYLNTYPGGIFWSCSREQDIGLQIVDFARTDLYLDPPDDLYLPSRVRWCWKRWKEGNALIVIYFARS